MKSMKEAALRNMTAIYIEKDGSMLMLYRIGSKVVAPSWCGVGGHFQPQELNKPRACMLRELQEEAGLCESDITSVEMRYVTLRLKNGEIRQNYYFFAKLREGAAVNECTDEGILRWIPIKDVLELEMPVTAKQMLTHYFGVGRFTEEIYCGVTGETGMEFAVLQEF